MVVDGSEWGWCGDCMIHAGGQRGHRVALLGVAGFSQLALSCAPPEDATPPAGAEERSAGVYRGTVVSDVDAMDGGHVALGVPEKLLGAQCSGTFIGPN